MGVPDFRTTESLSPYHEKPSEWMQWDLEMASAMIDAYPRMGYEEFVRYSVMHWGTHLGEDLKEHYIQFRLADRIKGEHIAQLLEKTVRSHFGNPPGDLVSIDAGCGTGAGIYALSKFCRTVVGLDMRLVDLIVARKFLEHEGIANVHLLCGLLESPPLSLHAFDIAIARDVIEHAASPVEFLRRYQDLLSPSGLLNFNSPNRYALRREPHVLLPAVGFLPRCLQRKFVKFFKGHAYTNTKLLSAREIDSLARAAHGFTGKVVGSGIEGRRIRALINRLPWKAGEFFGRLFSDSFEVFLFGTRPPGRSAE
jgi:2-polyprenyl-3-methyl-5-hydroxy-6-metoxy-1,4-benzoquinol methylase